MSEYQHCQVATTVGSNEAAETLARSAVEARVAACAQVSGPIRSTYWWDGELESEQEWYVVFKTSTARYPELEQHIRDHHSYDVPEIICTPVTAGNPDYLSWVTAETTPR